MLHTDKVFIEKTFKFRIHLVFKKERVKKLKQSSCIASTGINAEQRLCVKARKKPPQQLIHETNCNRKLNENGTFVSGSFWFSCALCV